MLGAGATVPRKKPGERNESGPGDPKRWELCDLWDGTEKRELPVSLRDISNRLAHMSESLAQLAHMLNRFDFLPTERRMRMTKAKDH